MPGKPTELQKLRAANEEQARVISTYIERIRKLENDQADLQQIIEIANQFRNQSDDCGLEQFSGPVGFVRALMVRALYLLKEKARLCAQEKKLNPSQVFRSNAGSGSSRPKKSRTSPE